MILGLDLGWVRSVLGMSWEELNAAFRPETLPTDLLFLPYLSGERTPHMDSQLRVSWSGLRVTGGGSQSPRFMQFLCDLLSVPLQLAQNPNASAMGAAQLAARTVGADPISVGAQQGPLFEPRPLVDSLNGLVERFQAAQHRQ